VRDALAAPPRIPGSVDRLALTLARGRADTSAVWQFAGCSAEVHARSRPSRWSARARCVAVSTIGASGTAIHERLPTVIEAVLRQADHERQLVGLGWYLARFDHGVRDM